MPETIHNPVQKDSVTFLETAEETGRTLVEIDLAPGGGNRLHRHLAYAERFEVLEGTLTVQVGRQKLRLGPGETAIAPARSRHAFSNDTGEPVRFLVELTPGHAGFEQALRIGYGLATDGETTRDGIPNRISDMAVLAQMSEIRICGPLATLHPIFGVVARHSEARRRELIETYCARAGHDTYAANPALRTAGT